VFCFADLHAEIVLQFPLELFLLELLVEFLFADVEAFEAFAETENEKIVSS
jgi:hypothetical protein